MLKTMLRRDISPRASARRAPSSVAVRRSVIVAASVLVAASAACSQFLEVKNPGAIEEKNIDNPAYLSLLVNGVIGEFQPAYTSASLYGAVLSDEVSNWHGFSENIEIDNRSVGPGNGTASNGVYVPLQSTRFLADSTIGLVTQFLGDTASRDVRLARVQAYAGYAYVLLAENMCYAPIGIGRSYASDELLVMAVARFTDAMATANAAKTYYTTLGTAGAKNVASADSLLSLANVGAARASLDLGNKPEAITFASAVPTGFAFKAYYSANSARENNSFFAAASNGQAAEWIGVSNTPYAAVTNDPRVPRPATTEGTMQGQTFVPKSPLSFSTYNGTLTGAQFTRDASMTFASGLEAQYILAEAQGATSANVTFLNSRRAIGGMAPLVAPSEADFQAALREQRARDLYLAGYRVGDLRRYKKLYSVDLWQHGPYSGPPTVAVPPTFGDAECFPVPLAELNGNPAAKEHP
jgi:hypothetical protein